MPNTKPKPKLPAEQEQFLLNPPEIAVFMACCVVVNELRALEQAFKAGEIERGTFSAKTGSLLPKLSKAAYGCERFDVVMPVLEGNQFSTVFWRWFNWWEDYFLKLTPLEICEIERLGKELRFSVNDYRPKTHWSTYRRTPGFGILEV
jgi:hypothetical protein